MLIFQVVVYAHIPGGGMCSHLRSAVYAHFPGMQYTFISQVVVYAHIPGSDICSYSSFVI